MPLTKFETIFCKPKPSPTPIAPLNTVNAVRSIPTALSPISSARNTSTILNRLRVSVWIDGLSPAMCSIRPPTSRASASAAHNRIAISSAALTTSSSDSRTVPIVSAALSSDVERRAEQPENVERRDDPGRRRDDAGQQRVVEQQRRGAQHDPQRGQRRGNPDQPQLDIETLRDQIGRRRAAARRRPAL